jgi:hypothetical protein
MEQLMIKKCLASLLLVGLFVGPVRLCQAQVFAEVKTIVSTTDPTKVQYTWDNPTQTFTTNPTPTPIVFAFDVLGAPSGLNDVNATMTITGMAPPGPLGFYNAFTQTQPIANLTFTINAVGGMGYAPGQLLLMGTFQIPALPNAFLTQTAPGTANLSSSNVGTPGGLTLISPYFMFDPAQMESATWSFSTINPALFTQTGDYLSSIPLINGNGNFAARTAAVPEPGVVSTLLGAGIVGGLFIRRRRRA